MGFFSFGEDSTCYGAFAREKVAQSHGDPLYDAQQDAVILDGHVVLPFDAGEVADNLRREAYIQEWRQGSASVSASLYYTLSRPLLTTSVPQSTCRSTT